tara:strand:- start:595 stop:834 length:240 start_codon:yes stop_codon:yes gene_type:complete
VSGNSQPRPIEIIVRAESKCALTGKMLKEGSNGWFIRLRGPDGRRRAAIASVEPTPEQIEALAAASHHHHQPSRTLGEE